MRRHTLQESCIPQVRGPWAFATHTHYDEGRTVSGRWPLLLTPLGLYFFPPLCILTESISRALNTGNMI